MADENKKTIDYVSIAAGTEDYFNTKIFGDRSYISLDKPAIPPRYKELAQKAGGTFCTNSSSTTGVFTNPLIPSKPATIVMTAGENHQERAEELAKHNGITSGQCTTSGPGGTNPRSYEIKFYSSF